MTASTGLPSLAGILEGPRGRRAGYSASPAVSEPAAPVAPAEGRLQPREPAERSELPDREPAVSPAASRAEPTIERPPGGEASIESDDVVYVTSRTVYLPRSVHRAANRWVRNRREVSWTTLILDALNETHLELSAFFAAAEPAGRSATDLFTMPQRSKSASEPSFQITVRLTDEQLDVIDQLSSRHNVTRSRLLAAAVRLYLTPRMPNERWTDMHLPKSSLVR